MSKLKLFASAAFALCGLISVPAFAFMKLCPDGTAIMATNPCPFPNAPSPDKSGGPAPVFVPVPAAEDRANKRAAELGRASIPEKQNDPKSCDGCGAK